MSGEWQFCDYDFGGSDDFGPSKPAAPAPQAEGACQTVTQCPKFAWCVMGHDHKGTCSSFHYELTRGAAPAETARAAKAIFTVHVSCGIGLYKGDWTGKEQKYERQNAVVLETENQIEAEALYERLSHFNGETAGEMTALRKRLMEEWLAQNITLDFRNWLVQKVADLEREREDLKESLRVARQAVLGLLPRAEAAESELREMREATDKLLAKAGKMSLSRSLVDTADLESLRLLARKAGS